MRYAIQPRVLLVVGIDDVPGRKGSIGREKHIVSRARVVVPSPMRFEVHWTKFPDFPTVVDATEKALGLFLLTHLKPILYQYDSIFDHCAFPIRAHLQKSSCVFSGAEAHNPLDAGAVVPATIEDNYLA